jgi:hypothetical protein
MAALAVAAVVIVAMAVPTVRYLREAPPPSPPETRLDIVTPATSDPFSFTLSPDGRQLVFVASGEGPARLWLRPLDKTTAQPLAGTEGASFPFWSPDGLVLGFFGQSVEADRPRRRIGATLGHCSRSRRNVGSGRHHSVSADSRRATVLHSGDGRGGGGGHDARQADEPPVSRKSCPAVGTSSSTPRARRTPEGSISGRWTARRRPV